MVIMIIFLGLSVLLLIATVLYANYKKKSNNQIKEIVHNKRKIIEFKAIEKIRNQANKK